MTQPAPVTTPDGYLVEAPEFNVFPAMPDFGDAAPMLCETVDGEGRRRVFVTNSTVTTEQITGKKEAPAKLCLDSARAPMWMK